MGIPAHAGVQYAWLDVDGLTSAGTCHHPLPGPTIVSLSPPGGEFLRARNNPSRNTHLRPSREHVKPPLDDNFYQRSSLAQWTFDSEHPDKERSAGVVRIVPERYRKAFLASIKVQPRYKNGTSLI